MICLDQYRRLVMSNYCMTMALSLGGRMKWTNVRHWPGSSHDLFMKTCVGDTKAGFASQLPCLPALSNIFFSIFVFCTILIPEILCTFSSQQIQQIAVGNIAIQRLCKNPEHPAVKHSNPSGLSQPLAQIGGNRFASVPGGHCSSI